MDRFLYFYNNKDFTKDTVTLQISMDDGLGVQIAVDKIIYKCSIQAS